VSGWPSGWVSGAGDSAVYGRGLREFSVVQKPTGLFSPRRRRNLRRRFEKPATGLAGPTFAKPASANGDFLSPGERIKGEGERQNQFSSPVRPSQTDFGSGGLPRPARPFSPARRRARASNQ